VRRIEATCLTLALASIEDGSALDAHAVRGGGNAAGDFTAIGNQDLGKHAVSFWVAWKV
jgi:hypothetical protein